MGDFKSFSGHQVRQSTMPAANANAASWRQVFKRALEESTWKTGWHGLGHSHPIERPRIFMQKFLSWKFLTIAVLLVALGSLIAFAIIRYSTRPVAVKQVRSTVASGKSLLGLADSTKPKPAPGKPFVSETESHLPIPTVWTPAPGSPQTPWTPGTPQNGPQIPSAPQQFPTAPQASPQVAGPSAAQPSISANGSRSAFASLVYQARHDKHFGGCAGQLTLSATGLMFHCADDPQDSFQVALNEIGAVDENGVQLLSGKKYHFSISGMTKSAEQTLFANWLHQVR